MLIKQKQALNQQIDTINQAMAKLEKKISIYDEMIQTRRDMLNPLSKDYIHPKNIKK